LSQFRFSLVRSILSVRTVLYDIPAISVP